MRIQVKYSINGMKTTTVLPYLHPISMHTYVNVCAHAVLYREKREIPQPQLIRLWCFLSLWMAIQNIVFPFYRWAGPYIAGCKPTVLAIVKISDLMNTIKEKKAAI